MPSRIGLDSVLFGTFCAVKKPIYSVGEWCSGRDLNPHGFRHTPLKRTCLPIPPPELLRGARTCSEARTFRKESFQNYVIGAAAILRRRISHALKELPGPGFLAA